MKSVYGKPKGRTNGEKIQIKKKISQDFERKNETHINQTPHLSFMNLNNTVVVTNNKNLSDFYTKNSNLTVYFVLQVIKFYLQKGAEHYVKNITINEMKCWIHFESPNILNKSVEYDLSPMKWPSRVTASNSASIKMSVSFSKPSAYPTKSTMHVVMSHGTN